MTFPSNFGYLVRKQMPANEVDFELVAKEAPIPVEVLIEREGRARNAKKATREWDGLTVDFAHSEEVHLSRGAL